jgi:hypothetical protein
LVLTYGLLNFVDFLGSVVAFWRFYCPGTLTKEREAILMQREARAGVAISFLIMLLGVLVILASVGDLNAGPPDADEGLHVELVAAVSFVSIIVYTFMTAFKLRYARKLESDALLKDGLCSLIGVVLSVIICVNSWIINESPEMWRLDASLAIFCGVAALVIGLHGIIYASCIQGLPIFSSGWWWSEKERSLEMASEGVNAPSEAAEETTKLSEVI